MDQNQSFSNDTSYGDAGVRIRDIEERQRIMKDRILLIGQNLIDFKEKTSDDLIELKKDIQTLKTDIKRIKDFLESFTSESANFARKTDIDILYKQAKMFQPLNLVSKDEVKELIKEEVRKHYKLFFLS